MALQPGCILREQCEDTTFRGHSRLPSTMRLLSGKARSSHLTHRLLPLKLSSCTTCPPLRTNREDAERAIRTLNGYGYDNLILRLEWAQPREK